MTLQSCRWRPSWTLALALLLCGGLLGSCDSSSVGDARYQFSIGNIDTAETFLGGASGPEAEALRREIAAGRVARVDLQARLEQLAQEDPEAERAELERILKRTQDPIARQWIERGISSSVDRAAANRASRAHTKIRFSSNRSGRRDETDFEGPLEDLEPEQALESRASLAVESPEPAAHLEIAATSEPEPEPEPESAPRAAQPTAVATSPVPLEGDAEGAAALARGGDLAGALALYLKVSLAAPAGPERDALIGCMRSIERRLQLRAEILAARTHMAAKYALELNLLDGNEVILQLKDGPVSWSAWPLSQLKRAANLAQLSGEAQLGLLDERLLRGDGAGPSGALAVLARFVDEGLILEPDAWQLVASQRGEAVPAGGYVWNSKRWVALADYLDAKAKVLLASLERKFKKAKPGADRQEIWDALLDLGPDAVDNRGALLERQWSRALKTVEKGGTLKSLVGLSKLRRELDARRKLALELIFDEEEYFYPYRPPECPPDKARLYWSVQRRVDELVGAVRQIWDSKDQVKLPAGFRAALGDLSWTLEHGQDQGALLDLPTGFPAWIWSLPLDLERVSLAGFAWDPAERDDLRYNRIVDSYCQRLWKNSDLYSEEQISDRTEQRQVEITNEYRKMFGHRALAWNPLLQHSAGMHSDYMALTGDFGHFEKGDPDRRSPFDRMRLVGYDRGASENCYMGGGSPDGAHDGWIHSSGHHRNILMPGHREMASGLSGAYWTQNFGTDSGFTANLESWQD
ncbi:MAG: CAP domain-containing protein [bacterium]|nr:CAP domain-containing protein [Planctomycetota bacterium]HIL53035.1 CAP domain-containing protein [Planctomycetota bacterium]